MNHFGKPYEVWNISSKGKLTLGERRKGYYGLFIVHYGVKAEKCVSLVCDCVNRCNNNDVCWRLGSVTCIASNYLGIHCWENAGGMVEMTTDDFIGKVNDLDGVYASKHREGHRMLIDIFKTCDDMCFAEIFVKRRILNLFILPQPTEVVEDVSRELLRLIADYQLETGNRK